MRKVVEKVNNRLKRHRNRVREQERKGHLGKLNIQSSEKKHKNNVEIEIDLRQLQWSLACIFITHPKSKNAHRTNRKRRSYTYTVDQNNEKTCINHQTILAFILYRPDYSLKTTDNWQLKSFSRLAKVSGLIHCVCIRLYIINFNDIVVFFSLRISVQFSSIRFGSERVKLCTVWHSWIGCRFNFILSFSLHIYRILFDRFPYNIQLYLSVKNKLFVFQCASALLFSRSINASNEPVCKLIGTDYVYWLR